VAYTFRFLTAEQRSEIGERATAPPAETAPDEVTLRAWEADLAAHQALLAAAKDDEQKSHHVKAVKALETALTAAANGR
jgi:hypothetical protein